MKPLFIIFSFKPFDFCKGPILLIFPEIVVVPKVHHSIPDFLNNIIGSKVNNKTY